jgi:hypothetical protein
MMPRRQTVSETLLVDRAVPCRGVLESTREGVPELPNQEVRHDLALTRRSRQALKR